MKKLLAKIKASLTREKLKYYLKRTVQFIANPRLLLCLAVGWMITNGWSYVMFAVGTICEIEWMIAVGGAYLAFLWLPVSPEKLVTCAIAIALLRWLFPQDEKTLAVLRGWYEKARSSVHARKARRQEEQAAGK